MWSAVLLYLCAATCAFGATWPPPYNDASDWNYHNQSLPDFHDWDPDVYSYSFSNVQATSTKFLADFVGINFHGTNYAGAYHDNKTQIVEQLLDAGIRHLRLGLLPDHTIDDLIEFGNKGFKMSISCDNPETYMPADIVAAIKTINANFTNRGLEPVVVLMEGPNEPDNFWQGQYYREYEGQSFPYGPVNMLKDCYTILKSDPETAWIKVSGIAVGTNDYYTANNVIMSDFTDWGNYHPYPYGGNSMSYPFAYLNISQYYHRGNFPSCGIDEWPFYRETAAVPYPGRPMMVSEAGYNSISQDIVPLPLFPYSTYDVQAKYTPRLYLEHFRLGTKRVMLYESSDHEMWTPDNYLQNENFGILDGLARPKPAYFAMKSLMNLLDDTLPPYPQANDDSYVESVNSQNVVLSYTITMDRVVSSDSNASCIEFGGMCNVYYRMYMVHHVVLQRKETNDLFFVVWHEVSNEDTNPRDWGAPPISIAHPPIPIQIHLDSPLSFSQSDSRFYTYDENYNYVASPVTFYDSATIAISALDSVSVLQLRLVDPGQDKNYIGCYIDGPTRDLNGPTYSDGNSMTPAVCESWCALQGYRYAGVQYADECHCGNSYGLYGPAPESDCNMPCTGDSSIQGGGSWRNSLYKTNYMGCYVDSENRDLPYLALFSDSLTIEQCLGLCKDAGYAYAGQQNTDECWCGNNYGSQGAGNDSDCYMQCSGNSYEICGGAWRNSVFAV